MLSTSENEAPKREQMNDSKQKDIDVSKYNSRVQNLEKLRRETLKEL